MQNNLNCTMTINFGGGIRFNFSTPGSTITSLTLTSSYYTPFILYFYSIISILYSPYSFTSYPIFFVIFIFITSLPLTSTYSKFNIFTYTLFNIFTYTFYITSTLYSLYISISILSLFYSLILNYIFTFTSIYTLTTIFIFIISLINYIYLYYYLYNFDGGVFNITITPRGIIITNLSFISIFIITIILIVNIIPITLHPP